MRPTTKPSAGRLKVLSIMREEDWQAQVVRWARRMGWDTYHTWDSRHSAAGFPDLVLLRDERMVVAELKSERGKTTESQDLWLGAFQKVELRPEVFVWRPRDELQVVEVLQ